MTKYSNFYVIEKYFFLESRKHTPFECKWGKIFLQVMHILPEKWSIFKVFKTVHKCYVNLNDFYLFLKRSETGRESSKISSSKIEDAISLFMVITHAVCLFAAVLLLSLWRVNLYLFSFVAMTNVICFIGTLTHVFCLFFPTNFHYLSFYRTGTRHASLCCSDFVTLAYFISFCGVGKYLHSFIFMIAHCLWYFEESVHAISLSF